MFHPVVDELHPVASGHEAIGEPERFEEDTVSRLLVVERELVAVVPHLDHTTVDVDPSGRTVDRREISAALWPIDGLGRVL